MEIVKNISYLGIHFSSSGKFNFAADQMVNKARSAAANLKIVMSKSGMDSYSARYVLYKSTVLTVLLYASEIWGLNREDNIERGQVQFYKSLHFLSRSTPGYIIRKEFQQKRVIIYDFKRPLNGYIKFL